MKGQYPIEETCSELTFSFWHALQVFDKISYSKIWFYFQEEITATNEENNKGVILDLFRPYFEHLIEVVISKGQVPVNENVFTSEDKEIFRAYRSDIIDTMVIEEK
jgi:hypothetical protein